MKKVFLCAIVILFICSFASGETLKSLFFGNPVADMTEPARKINELCLFNNRLYIGYGDYGVNTGPTDVIYYDFGTKTWNKEFTVDDEAIVLYRIIDNKLFIPGVDACEKENEWDFGNYYELTDAGWKKHRTVPSAVHVFDIAKKDSTIYLATGEVIYNDSLFIAPGAVMVSRNGGESFNFSYTSPSDENLVYRIKSLAVFQGKIYAFPYGYSFYMKDDIPSEYLQYYGDPYTEDGVDYYLTLEPNLLGGADFLVFDKNKWKGEDIIFDEKLCNINGYAFKDKLLLTCTFGDYVSSPLAYVKKHQKMPANTRSAMYVYDGKKNVKLNFSYDIVVDVLVKESVLYLLYLKGGRYSIMATSDFSNWAFYDLPDEIHDPLSLEVEDVFFYVGTESGVIFELRR
ncbi:MAG: hypothetical protein PHW02_03705 [bacterium]|nr:hypothetical protein [bacterium]